MIQRHSEELSTASMTWKGISMGFGMTWETVTQILRECRALITSHLSNGDGNVLTTMSLVRYNERVI
ncbi:hypothetical protein SSM1_093 [Synechococcus phage S-SM1]|uniref:Uncharacterized protein n=1 Tax=Synechococcus phage S-SM1 TaxID=444859 RepID=E3SIA0_9CAUD|nr:hypothetical protein SSM1_093 [Synechococcus phage S-SM1]ADO97257.1 hypothetical protein SSM1_093 [Synechococcus phage S-SM1]